MGTPFFSVIIPTRNRPETLEYSLKTVLNQTYTNFELIVSDNSNNDSTEELLNKVEDKRIKYYRTNGQLSMSENWEFALGFVKGRYVIYIGDDDGLLINALEKAFEYINDKSPEVLFCKGVSYFWPHASKTRTNLILFNNLKDNIHDSYNMSPKNNLENILSCNFQFIDVPIVIPTIYNAFVSTDFVVRIKGINGRFFNSTMPDMYSAIAISLFANNILRVNDHLLIRGFSSYSNAAAYWNPTQKNKEVWEDFTKLNEKSDVRWNDEIPFVGHIYSFLIESYFQLYTGVLKRSISQKFWILFYLRLMRRVFEKNEKELVANELEAIHSTLKNSKYVYRIFKYLLLIYNTTLIERNKKRPLLPPTTDEVKYGIHDNSLTIDGEKFNIKDVYDLQLFLNRFLN